MVAFLMSLRSLVMRTKDDMVDGPRLVPPVIQCARRAFLERNEVGALGSFSLDMLEGVAVVVGFLCGPSGLFASSLAVPAREMFRTVGVAGRLCKVI